MENAAAHDTGDSISLKANCDVAGARDAPQKQEQLDHSPSSSLRPSNLTPKPRTPPATATSPPSDSPSAPPPAASPSTLQHRRISATITMAEDPVRAPELAVSSTTFVELQSASATSSAFPENLSFQISLNGAAIVAYTSSHIWVIKAADLPRVFIRAFEVRRKPVALDILDDHSILAVLSNPHTVDIFRLNGGAGMEVSKLRSVFLSQDTRTIALSPDGKILATGHDHGIELVRITPDALEGEKRGLVCPDMDSLRFSNDSETLIATSAARRGRETTLFNVSRMVEQMDGTMAVSEEGEVIREDTDRAWIREILLPNTIRSAQQAIHIRDRTEEAFPRESLFAFDGADDTFRLFDLTHAHFLSSRIYLPSNVRRTRTELLEDAMPAVSGNNDHAAVAIKQHGGTAIWVYRLPDDWVNEAWMGNNSQRPATTLNPSIMLTVATDTGPAAQGIVGIRWLEAPNLTTTKQRLLAVGCSKGSNSMSDLLSTQPATGQVVIVDFDVRDKTNPDAPTELQINLDNVLPGERLPQEGIAFEREVEMARTRSIAQRNAELRQISSLNSRSTTQLGRAPHLPSFRRTRTSVSSRRGSGEEDDDIVALDEPYSQGAPRSGASLQRAATVSANAPAARRHLRALPNQPLEVRRADGLAHIPHESDADNWVPPPPPYSERPDAPGPHAQSVSIANAALISPQTQPPVIPQLQRQHTGPAAAYMLQRPPLQPYMTPRSPQPYSTPYGEAQRSRMGSISYSHTFPFTNGQLPMRARTHLHVSAAPTPQPQSVTHPMRSSTQSQPHRIPFFRPGTAPPVDTAPVRQVQQVPAHYVNPHSALGSSYPYGNRVHAIASTSNLPAMVAAIPEPPRRVQSDGPTHSGSNGGKKEKKKGGLKCTVM